MAASSLPLHDMLQYDGRAASQKCRAEINSSSNERHLCTLHPHPPSKNFNKCDIFRSVSTIQGGLVNNKLRYYPFFFS